MLLVGHTPSTAGTFRKIFGKNGKTPETLSERFLEFPSRVRLGCPKPYNSRHLGLRERFQNSLPPSTAGDASFFRIGSGEGLSELVMEFPAVLGVFLTGPPKASSERNLETVSRVVSFLPSLRARTAKPLIYTKGGVSADFRKSTPKCAKPRILRTSGRLLFSELVPERASQSCCHGTLPAVLGVYLIVGVSSGGGIATHLLDLLVLEGRCSEEGVQVILVDLPLTHKQIYGEMITKIIR